MRQLQRQALIFFDSPFGPLLVYARTQSLRCACDTWARSQWGVSLTNLSCVQQDSDPQLFLRPQSQAMFYQRVTRSDTGQSVTLISGWSYLIVSSLALNSIQWRVRKRAESQYVSSHNWENPVERSEWVGVQPCSKRNCKGS